MPQLRTDYTQRSVSLVPPNGQKAAPSEDNSCRYCEGNEYKTPPAELVLLDRLGGIVKTSDSEEERHSNWVARVFRSPHPLVFEDPNAGYSDEPLLGEPASGSHYIVVISPKHDHAFHSAGVNQIANGLIAMQEQVKSLYQGKGVSYVAVFANQAQGPGTQSHPHMELISFGKIPPVIDKELEVTDSIFNELSICPLCRVVNVETGGPRQILSTENYIAFVPWAPLQDEEFWIVPKKHQRSYLKLTQNQVKELALIMRCTLGGYAKQNAPEYSVSFHMAPERKQQSQYHWHIEIHPPSRAPDALQLGFGVHVMQKTPEESAERLGRAARREMAEIMGVR